MRLVTQKGTQRKQNLVPGGAAQNGRNQPQNQFNQTLINGMMQIGSHGQVQGGAQKNAWQSLDANSVGGDMPGANQAAINQGLMIQPCSN